MSNKSGFSFKEILIIEDSADNAEELQNLLQNAPVNSDCLIVDSIDNLTEIEEELDSFDLIITDLEINNGNVFDVITDPLPVPVIVLTGHPEYALSAYNRLIDAYLLKPLNEKLFFEALKKIDSRISTQQHEKVNEEFVMVRSDGIIYQLNWAEIAAIEASRKKVIIYTGEQILNVQQKLSVMQSKMPSYFFKPHRKFLVNRHFIRKFEKITDTYHLFINNPNLPEVPVSRRFSPLTDL